MTQEQVDAAWAAIRQVKHWGTDDAAAILDWLWTLDDRQLDDIARRFVDWFSGQDESARFWAVVDLRKAVGRFTRERMQSMSRPRGHCGLCGGTGYMTGFGRIEYPESGQAQFILEAGGQQSSVVPCFCNAGQQIAEKDGVDQEFRTRVKEQVVLRNQREGRFAEWFTRATGGRRIVDLCPIYAELGIDTAMVDRWLRGAQVPEVERVIIQAETP